MHDVRRSNPVQFDITETDMIWMQIKAKNAITKKLVVDQNGDPGHLLLLHLHHRRV
jgi:hypothetical protein